MTRFCVWCETRFDDRTITCQPIFIQAAVWFTRHKFHSARRSLCQSPSARSRDASSNCPSTHPELVEILSDPVAICRVTNHWRSVSDRWSKRPSHNVKKPPPSLLITTAPTRMRQRKSFVHFPVDVLSPTCWRYGSKLTIRQHGTIDQGRT